MIRTCQGLVILLGGGDWQEKTPHTLSLTVPASFEPHTSHGRVEGKSSSASLRKCVAVAALLGTLLEPHPMSSHAQPCIGSISKACTASPGNRAVKIKNTPSLAKHCTSYIRRGAKIAPSPTLQSQPDGTFQAIMFMAWVIFSGWC